MSRTNLTGSNLHGQWPGADLTVQCTDLGAPLVTFLVADDMKFGHLQDILVPGTWEETTQTMYEKRMAL